jgi:hypothetical protein
MHTTDFSLLPVTLFTLSSQRLLYRAGLEAYFAHFCLVFLFLCRFLAVTFTVAKLFKHKAGRKYENKKNSLPGRRSTVLVAGFPRSINNRDDSYCPL